MKKQFTISTKHAAIIVVTLIIAATMTHAATLTFDHLNRLTSVNYGNGNSVLYSYDAFGNMLSRTAVGTAIPDSVPQLRATIASQPLPPQQSSATIQVANIGGGVMHWTATVMSGLAWLSITSGQSGTGNGVVEVLAIANPDTSMRSASVRIASTEAYNGYVDVVIEQQAAAFVSGVFATNPPVEFGARQNYPNPFNPQTTIEFAVPRTAMVTLAIFDVRGRLVMPLIRDEMFEPGWHSVVWDGDDQHGNEMPSGVYFCRFEAGNKRDVSRMVLLR